MNPEVEKASLTWVDRSKEYKHPGMVVAYPAPGIELWVLPRNVVGVEYGCHAWWFDGEDIKMKFATPNSTVAKAIFEALWNWGLMQRASSFELVPMSDFKISQSTMADTEAESESELEELEKEVEVTHSSYVDHGRKS